MRPLSIMTTGVFPSGGAVSRPPDPSPEGSTPSYSPLGWQLTSVLGADRCDTGHPSHPDTWCFLRVGHGGPHRCCAREGSSHEWGMSRTVDLRAFYGLSDSHT